MIDRDETTTYSILDQLKVSGWIIESSNTKGSRKGKGKAGTPIFTFVNDEDRLQHVVFHPRLNLEHHVSSSSYNLC